MIEIRIMPTCKNVNGHLSLLVICLGVQNNWELFFNPFFLWMAPSVAICFREKGKKSQRDM